MDCFHRAGHEDNPSDVVFVHRFSFAVLAIDSRIHSTTFATAYGCRSIEWYFDVCSDRGSPQIRLAQRRRRSEETYPTGSCRLSFKVVSRNYDTSVESETKDTVFSGFHVVPDSSEFFRSLFRTLGNPKYDGGQISFLLRISFSPENFFQTAARSSVAPPVALPTDDFRILSLAHITHNQSDFKIVVKDGEIAASKYLLYVTMNHFHELLCSNPCASVANLNFTKETVTSVLDFAFKGTFGLANDDIGKIRDFLNCTRTTKPIGFEALTKYIGSMLSAKIVKDWRGLDVHDATRLFDIAYEHGFIGLLDGSMNLIADRYYNDFKLHYNESSEGEQAEIFARLIHSDIADFLAPCSVLAEAFRKHGTSVRVLKYKEVTADRLEIIC